MLSTLIAAWGEGLLQIFERASVMILHQGNRINALPKGACIKQLNLRFLRRIRAQEHYDWGMDQRKSVA